MSLIACYECETPVSEHADRCALCRAPIEAEPIRSRPLVSWPLVALVIAVTAILAGCGDSGTEPTVDFPVAFHATSPAEGTAYTSFTCQGAVRQVEFVRATLFLDEPDADGLGIAAGLVVDRWTCSSEVVSTWSVGGVYELVGDSIRFRSGSIADAEWAGAERMRFTTGVRLRGELVAVTFEREGVGTFR